MHAYIIFLEGGEEVEEKVKEKEEEGEGEREEQDEDEDGGRGGKEVVRILLSLLAQNLLHVNAESVSRFKEN